MDSSAREKRRATLAAIAALALALPTRAQSHAPPGTREQTIALPGFGPVSVYRPEPLARARGVVLFVSGDGGWNLGVVDMARRLSDRAVVAGLSMPSWQRKVEASPGRCWYPAGELETAAQALEKALGLPSYVAPVLVGYSSGATVVYGALAQAPATTFAGAVSLGFCPDLEVRRPLCGTGAWRPSYDAKKPLSLLPASPALAARQDGRPRWVALQGTIDQVCDPSSTRRFVGAIPSARIVMLDKVGHGFSVPRRWAAAFDAAVAGLLEPGGLLEPPSAEERRRGIAASPDDVEARLSDTDLPLEVSWPQGAHEAVVFVSGDGGWADLDRAVAAGLSERGIAVVGWNTLRYFWSAKTPERFSKDLARVVASLPEGMRVYVGGYSFGAESVPWAVAEGRARGDAAIARIAGLVLLDPGRYATFEVSPLDWVRASSTPTSHPVAAALEQAGSLPVLCVDGSDDERSGCHGLPRAGLVHVEIPGGHHFGGEFGKLAEEIARFVGSSGAARADSRAGVRR